MKIVVIGGTGLIGTKLVTALRVSGHTVKSASRSSGVNTVTGEGLADALDGADVVVDVSNSNSLDEAVALAFFLSSGRNLLAAGKAAGIRHHVALSAVGTDRMPESGYFRAKMAQENLVRASGVPYTILRSTPFFEFINGIVEADARGNALRVAPAHLQPIAADDAVAALLDVARCSANSSLPGRRRSGSTNWLGRSSPPTRILAWSSQTAQRPISAPFWPMTR